MPSVVTAPMIGKIVELKVKVGDKVSENQVLMVMEAMKMKIDVVSTAAGIVSKIAVQPGQQVEAEMDLAFIE